MAEYVVVWLEEATAFQYQVEMCHDEATALARSEVLHRKGREVAIYKKA